MTQEYLNLFIDDNYPNFIDKYLKTKTLNRLKYITQFCGCDYTNLYNPLFLYTRFDHSLVVAHMTWHFTHDKIQTIAALLHDVGTPCFAHCIDYVFGDYMKQETSEREIMDIINKDKKILTYLKEDNIDIDQLTQFEKLSILENESPQLCTDRLDGVLHTCYIWLHTHSLIEIKKIYDDMTVLTDEKGYPEIGFKNQKIVEKFVDMVFIYGKELQSNKDKYVMQFVAETVKKAILQGLITIDCLYEKTELEIMTILKDNFSSWNQFQTATTLIQAEEKPNNFYVSFATKKRNTIPLVDMKGYTKRVINISKKSEKKYTELENYRDTKYAYVESIKMV